MSKQLDLQVEALADSIFRDLLKKLRVLLKEGAEKETVGATLRKYAAWLDDVNINEVEKGGS